MMCGKCGKEMEYWDEDEIYICACGRECDKHGDKIINGQRND